MLLRVTTSRIRAALAAAAVVPVLAALGACSAEVSVGSDKEYDAEAVAKMVKETQEEAAPDLEVGTASCPEDVELEEGVEFECTVSVEGTEAPYTVTIGEVGDTSAQYDMAPAQAIVRVDKAVGFIEDQAEAQGITGATADCGDQLVLVQEPQTTFDCTLTKGNRTQDVSLLIEDVNGTVSFDAAS